MELFDQSAKAVNTLWQRIHSNFYIYALVVFLGASQVIFWSYTISLGLPLTIFSDVRFQASFYSGLVYSSVIALILSQFAMMVLSLVALTLPFHVNRFLEYRKLSRSLRAGGYKLRLILFSSFFIPTYIPFWHIAIFLGLTIVCLLTYGAYLRWDIRRSKRDSQGLEDSANRIIANGEDASMERLEQDIARWKAGSRKFRRRLRELKQSPNLRRLAYYSFTGFALYFVGACRVAKVMQDVDVVIHAGEAVSRSIAGITSEFLVTIDSEGKVFLLPLAAIEQIVF